MSLLKQLQNVTKVVADTGDFQSIESYRPTDATTNPSLIYQAALLPKYQYLVNEAIVSSSGDLESVMDHLVVSFGCQILDIIPGRVSTEVDARLSFDTAASVDKALRLIDLYDKNNVSSERILIKLASTWEGIQAAEILEKQGISCNLTLLFSMVQAVQCANANVTLISPFVGRILDWYKNNQEGDFTGANDPGVQSVSRIYSFYKQNNIRTEIMGASFRNTDEILQLAGCDLLTISPSLLKELDTMETQLDVKLSAEKAMTTERETFAVQDEKHFRWLFNQDAMATEKLSEGIRNFYADQLKLEKYISSIA